MSLPPGHPVYVVVQRPPGNPAAAWSVVLGVVQLLGGGVFVWFFVGLWTVPVTLATVGLAHLGYVSAQRNRTGIGSSVAGLALGYVGVVNLLALAVALLYGAVQS